MATLHSNSTTSPSTASPAPAHLLRLEPGDRLNRAEFERRWELMPDLKKAELIEGVVYRQAAVSVGHGGPHAQFGALLVVYAASTPGTQALLEPSVRLDDQNEPQPDVCLRIMAGGSSSVDKAGFLTGAPELVVEIASSSASYDLHDKLNLYRRSGVQEYLVWRVVDNELDWFVLREGQYVPLEPSEGLYQSRVFPGLWLEKSALLAGDMATALATLGRGLADVAHRDFAARLARGGASAHE